jgi:hypothetical protein
LPEHLFERQFGFTDRPRRIAVLIITLGVGLAAALPEHLCERQLSSQVGLRLCFPGGVGSAFLMVTLGRRRVVALLERERQFGDRLADR